MTTTQSAKTRARLAKVEGIALSMGFLLAKLQARYGSDFGAGMNEQVRHALRDYHDLQRSIQQRSAPKATGATPLQGDSTESPQ